MHFIHSTILPQSEVENCTVLDVRQREVDILLFYHKFIKRATIYKKGNDISYKSHQTIYIETPILWGSVINNHFVSVTKNNQLIITEIGTSLKQISSVDLFETEGEYSEEFKYFSVSKDKNWILIASESDHFFFIDIKDISNPLIGARKVDNFTIKSVTPLSADDSFIILVKNDDEQKFVKFAAKKQDLSIDDADSDIEYLIDTETPAKSSHLIATSKTISSGSNQLLQITEPIRCFTKVVNDCCALQLESGNLHFLSQSQSIQIPGAPPIKSMWLLPNEAVITNLDDGKTIVFTVQKPSNTRKKPTHFSSLPQIDLEGTISSNQIIPHKNEILGIGRSGVTIISERANTDLSKSTKSVEKTRLLQVDVDCLAASGNGSTEVVFGDVEIDTEHEAISFINYRKSNYLVHEKGFTQSDGEEVVTFEEPIKDVAASGFRIVVISGTNTVSILDEEFKREDRQFPGIVTAVAVSVHYFAVYTYDNDPLVMNGCLSLYDYSFEKVCPDIKFPSVITSLSFGKNPSELYAASENGGLYKLPLSSTGFTPGVSLIYAGKAPARIIPYNGDLRFNIVTFGNTALLLIEGKLHDLGLSDFDSICLVSTPTDSLAVAMIKQNQLSIIPYDIDNRKQFKLIENTDNVISGTSFGDRAFFLHKEEEGIKLSMLVNDGKLISSEIIKANGNIISGASDILLVAISEPTPKIDILSVSDNWFKSVSSLQLVSPALLVSMHMSGKYFVVASEGRLTHYKLKDGVAAMSRGFCELTSKPLIMIWNGELIWIAFEDGSVIVYLYNDVAERFEILSRKSGIFGTTSAAVLDDITTAFGSSNGEITILKVDDARALGLSRKRELTKCATFIIDTPVLSLAVVKNVLLYLTTGGCIGAFSPYACTSDFLAMQQLQLQARKYITSNFGFCVLSRKALAAQYAVTDVTVFEIIGKQATIDKEMMDSLVYVNSLLGRERCRFMF